MPVEIQPIYLCSRFQQLERKAALMARQESDREDLMREATALAERAELELQTQRQIVTAGYRRNGALSLFFDQDPVYQFDSEHRLRRAYVDGFLFRSQHSNLARLERQRTADATILLREDLNADQLHDFRERMRNRLTRLLEALVAQTVSVRQAIPPDFDAIARLTCSVEAILRQGDDWLSPQINARR